MTASSPHGGHGPNLAGLFFCVSEFNFQRGRPVSRSTLVPVMSLKGFAWSPWLCRVMIASSKLGCSGRLSRATAGSKMHQEVGEDGRDARGHLLAEDDGTFEDPLIRRP